METKSNEPSKEFVDFFVMLTTAFNKPFTQVDLEAWWSHLGYDSNNLEVALEQQRILNKTIDVLLSPVSGYYDNIEKARFPTMLMFKDARLKVMKREKEETTIGTIAITDKKERNINVKEKITNLMNLVNNGGAVHTKLCEQDTTFHENGISGTITTDDQGRSYVEQT